MVVIRVKLYGFRITFILIGVDMSMTLVGCGCLLEALKNIRSELSDQEYPISVFKIRIIRTEYTVFKFDPD